MSLARFKQPAIKHSPINNANPTAAFYDCMENLFNATQRFKTS